MAKSPVDEKKKLEKLRKEIKETEKKAFIRSNSPSEEYEESPEEIRAQKKLKRLKRKLKKGQK
jgi:hypothetical protein